MMTKRERRILERVLIDLRADAKFPPQRSAEGGHRLRHYLKTLEAILEGGRQPFLRQHGYLIIGAVTANQE